MKRERLFYLDFIRAIAAIAIVITHYNAVYLYANPQINNCYVINAYVFNIYIGGFGVSLFLIISGAALMYVYGDGLKIKNFYWKRFKTLYPMFWIAYIVSFAYIFLYRGAWWSTSVPKKNILLSFIGMDGYLADVLPTFYLVGEWFLGFIVIFYVIYPILRYLVNKHPIVLAMISLGIYLYLIFNYSYTFASSKNILVRLPELLFGMYYIKYIKNTNAVTAIICALILICNQVLKPSLPTDLQTTYIGIASFLLLIYISKFIKSELVVKICAWVSKYSYAIFLVHHVVIFYVMLGFNLYTITHIESYLIFFGFCCVIAVMSKVLYEIDGFVENKIKNMYLLCKNKMKTRGLNNE